MMMMIRIDFSCKKCFSTILVNMNNLCNKLIVNEGFFLHLKSSFKYIIDTLAFTAQVCFNTHVCILL